jgi:hypothetical protein
LIKSVHNGLSLDIGKRNGVHDGSDIITWTHHGRANQQFRYDPATKAISAVRFKLVLEARFSPRLCVVAATPNGAAVQQWRIVSVGNPSVNYQPPAIPRPLPPAPPSATDAIPRPPPEDELPPDDATETATETETAPPPPSDPGPQRWGGGQPFVYVAYPFPPWALPPYAYPGGPQPFHQRFWNPNPNAGWPPPFPNPGGPSPFPNPGRPPPLGNPGGPPPFPNPGGPFPPQFGGPGRWGMGAGGVAQPGYAPVAPGNARQQFEEDGPPDSSW